jgi:hypothetical protein
VLDSKVYKFGNKRTNLPFCQMRPNTELENVTAIQSQIIDKSFELREGFKFAYVEFLKAYARRDFRVLRQLTEGRLEAAIKEEPKPCDEEIVYHLSQPTKALTQLNFHLVDYNFNVGVKTDRAWNFEHNLKELTTLNETLVSIYGPSSPVGLLKLAKQCLFSPQDIKFENLTVEFLIGFQGNIIVCDKKLAKVYNHNDQEIHFAKFEGTLSNCNLEISGYSDVINPKKLKHILDKCFKQIEV